MKENCSMAGKTLSRNWLIKRKRRKVPYGTDTSTGKQNSSKPLELPSNTSSIRRLKNEKTSEHPSGKRKGDDGVSFFLLFNFYFLHFESNIIGKEMSHERKDI